MLASGWLNSTVLVHGIVNIRWTGIPNACAQCMCAVYVRKAGWIGNNGLRHEWPRSHWIRAYTGGPAPAKHFGHHPLFGLDIAGTKALYAGDQAWVLHHVCHKLSWITADVEELKPRFQDKVSKDAVRGNSHSMAVFEQLAPEGDERLYISPASHHLDDDIQVYGVWSVFAVLGRRWLD